MLTYVKGFKAFGVKPADVAKSVVSAGQVKTIQSEPAFRYRFAKDFEEVTSALKPERLVIFVDDLDRCKPDQVLEILEAINFLAEFGRLRRRVGNRPRTRDRLRRNRLSRSRNRARADHR